MNQASDANFVTSPLSFRMALALVAVGSTGRTARQLLSFLEAKSREELNSLSSQISSMMLADGSALGGPLISFAAGIWFDKSTPLRPLYAQIVKGTYAAEANSVDFQTKVQEVEQEVNAWSEQRTKGIIKEILPPNSVDCRTKLILANALYFKGVWQEKFDASLTKDDDFYPSKGSPVRVPFMTSTEDRFIAVFPGFKVLKMPYKQGEDKRSFSMYFFLPDERNGLHNLLNEIDSHPEFINKHLPTIKVPVGNFMIPKFKITYSFEASEVLEEMGLVLPFSKNGELTEMVDSPLGSLLFVSKIFHKSFIEVNEEGTEAASVTAVAIVFCSLRKDIDFVADHPFMFLIREDCSGIVLFVGHVINPSLPSSLKI